MPGTLSICATPIGNLGDMTPRAVAALQSADVVLAEDTRVTRKLCAHFGIETALERFDEPTSARRIPEVLARLERGEKVALVSDAGTPLISDPGYQLVAAAQDLGHRIECVPGPSAVIGALSVCGLPTESFYFGGFLPRKVGDRRALLSSLAELPATLVFYESPHRLVASLDALAARFPSREGAVVRELTKVHEEVVRAPLSELAAAFSAREAVRGEIVVLVGPPSGSDARDEPTEAEVERALAARLAAGESPSRAARAVALELGLPKAVVYEVATRLGGGAR